MPDIWDEIDDIEEVNNFIVRESAEKWIERNLVGGAVAKRLFEAIQKSDKVQSGEAWADSEE